ncbi:hypothetical protein DICVIV_00816 [Dictyocaulus viviparus]|uniref:Ubiquitin-like domain-containing protein n=1 Tax=Dictyocaulus viviparus TaxID=29172 RepID=A0A0D8Y9R7_DICVI|nr:hypothetical protein DICVIV_00816 [Dictyocaulus viviparus]
MASVENASNTVELTVRCAFQTSDDIKVVCPVHWTIRKLKEHLHQVCPSHPAVTSQRLIFSGACLTDEMVVKDVIDRRKVVEGPQVLHLVCPLPHSSPPEFRHRKTTGVNKPSSSSTISASIVQPTVLYPSPSINYYEWYQYYYGANSPEHFERLQQYSRYYATYMEQWYEYQNFMLSQMGYTTTFGQQLENGDSTTQSMTVPFVRLVVSRGDQARVAVHNHAEVNAADAVQQIPADPNVAAAVPGQEPDVLDLVYRIFRVLLFLSAVMLYSSIERFLAVITIALFIFFIQLRRNQQRQARVAGADGSVNNNNTGEQSQNVAEQIQATSNAPAQPSGLQIFLATCYSFITSFFTSLVPDHPVPIDLN